MIRYPTLLILGAGASYPYGFPLGFDLRKAICAYEFDSNEVMNRFGINFTNEFISAFYRSHLNSIDAFLSKRLEYTDIGKAIIASIISSKELPDDIHSDLVEDNLYKYLWNRLYEETSGIEDFNENRLKIITFNYDRSLEYYLVTSIMNSFGVDIKTAFETMKHIEIIHFYGSLGELSLEYDKGSLPYIHNHPSDILFDASKNIRVMHEDRDTLINSEILNTWFEKARSIVFLGFGFDSLNTKRLGLAKHLRNTYAPTNFSKTIIASTFGLTNNEVDVAGLRVIGETFINHWSPSNNKSTDTLRNFANVLI